MWGSILIVMLLAPACTPFTSQGLQGSRTPCASLSRLCPVPRAGRQDEVLPGLRCLSSPRTEVRSTVGSGKLGGGRLWHLEWDRYHSWIYGRH